jgi:hypothetical protein
VVTLLQSANTANTPGSASVTRIQINAASLVEAASVKRKRDQSRLFMNNSAAEKYGIDVVVKRDALLLSSDDAKPPDSQRYLVQS